MLGDRFPPPPPPRTEPAPDTTRLGARPPAAPCPTGPDRDRPGAPHIPSTVLPWPQRPRGTARPARDQTAGKMEEQTLTGSSGYRRGRADSGLPPPRKRRACPVTPRSALLPRAEAENGGGALGGEKRGEKAERPGCALEAEPRLR